MKIDPDPLRIGRTVRSTTGSKERMMPDMKKMLLVGTAVVALAPLAAPVFRVRKGHASAGSTDQN
jgi:hypothetical protein